jgi:hypothetical protein
VTRQTFDGPARPRAGDGDGTGRAASEDGAARARDGLLELVLAELVERVASRLFELQPAPTESKPWRLLTSREVAACFGRSERWLRDRVRKGEIAVVRLDGGAPMFAPEDVKAFAAAHRIGGANGAAAAEVGEWWRA